jgi:GDP-mannose 6-dehydrogenase
MRAPNPKTIGNNCMKISIFGLGYVGAVSLACLSRDGHQVIGVDIDQTKLDLIAAGKTPVVEEGMVDLMQQGGRQRPRHRHHRRRAGRAGTARSRWSAWARPRRPTAARTRARSCAWPKMGRALAEERRRTWWCSARRWCRARWKTCCGRSSKRESGKKDGVDFHLCFQPEFLREGSSIRDYDKPPFTVVGRQPRPSPASAARLFGHLPCKFLETSVRSAEMMKYCCNNFHALKITFANETARLCGALGVDPFEVMDLVCQDTQLNISKAYLKPGFAFGGSCLPKDLRATSYLAKTARRRTAHAQAILASNQATWTWRCDKVLASGKRASASSA